MESVFPMFECGVLEIVFPQYRSTGVACRVSDSDEMLNSISIPFQEKGFLQTNLKLIKYIFHC